MRSILLSFSLASVIVSLGTACGPRSQEVPEVLVGHCVYTNTFSGWEECREYLGTDWSTDDATSDCSGAGGEVVLDAPCPYDETLGACVENGGTERVTRIQFPGDQAGRCTSLQRGCEVFAGGAFVAAGRCTGVVDDGPGYDPDAPNVFTPATQQCLEPKAGEPAGAGPDGAVCTWSAISACTEEGRRYADYASCEDVLTQRPYWDAPPAEGYDAPDARLSDPDYVAENTWVKEQIASCACICCHSEGIAPAGPSGWFVESGPNWASSFYESGLALGAGWVDSTAFGAYPAEANNGFVRGTLSGFPSTDPARMAAFFERELDHRGFVRADFADEPPFGGPLAQQLLYQPTACENGEGVDANGTLTWSGGPARYVYVLAEGTANPIVPPNLDLPEGTIWRLDVAPSDEPIASGITYGAVPDGASQRYPADGSPAELVPGTTYYLYVVEDIGIPLTRCLFVR